MTCCKIGCPLLRHAKTYVPYGDTQKPILEAYCAAGDEPETCEMMKEEEE